MNFDEILKKVTSGHIPAGVLGVGGIIVLWIALKSIKGMLKLLFILVALALLGGAVWWHFHQR